MGSQRGSAVPCNVDLSKTDPHSHLATSREHKRLIRTWRVLIILWLFRGVQYKVDGAQGGG